MRRTLLLLFVLVIPATLVAQSTITALEYFVDGDPGVGLATQVTDFTAGSTITKSFDIGLISVSDGFHTLSIRAKDSNGFWSPTATSPFYKVPAATFASAPNLTKMEYFIDGDKGAGNVANTAITISGPSISNQEVIVPLTSVSEGFHTLSIRAQDASGRWSTTFTSPFYKVPATTFASVPNLTKVEYFIDGDKGAGNAANATITISGPSISNQEVIVPLTSVSDGFHTISIRAQDASGRWSTTFTSPFYKLPASVFVAAPNITRLEYFFDDDSGPGSTNANNKNVTITPGTSVSLVDLSVDVSALSTGTHKISFRAQDANGKWSIVHTGTFGVFGPAPTAQPTNLGFSTITTTTYTANFTAASPPPDGGYIAIRKAGSAPTKDPDDGTTLVKGNSWGDGTVAYVGTATTFNETALSSGTQYYYKIYAYNGSTTLTNYLTTTPLQGNTSTLADPVLITQQALPSTFDKGGTLTVSVTVNSAAKASGVVLKYRGISEPASALKSVTVTNSGNKFEKVISASDLTDLIGIKYYFEVTDKSSGVVIISDTGKAYVRYPASSSDQKIPSLSFGDKQSNYQIIAVPLILSNDDVSTVFSALGEYDNTQWRLYDYGLKDIARDNREYTDGYFSTIKPGKGYWLIARNTTIINPGEGTAAGSDLLVDETTPFKISLVSGWNLIGNPYNFPISWTEVRTANGNPAGVETSVYRFKNGTLSPGVEMDRYQGAFIKSTSNIEIQIPTQRNPLLTGDRISSEKIDLLKNQWTIPISVSNGDLTNETGGIGMHPKAQLDGKDDFDRTRVPLLDGMNMPELIFSSSTSKIDITREVVPSQDHFTWKFEVKQSDNEFLKLAWPTIENKGDKQLLLLDLASQRVMDMTKENGITISPDSKSFKIIFGDPNYITRVLEKELPAIGQPYPNPAQAEVKIPFFISESLDNSKVSIRIYNNLGKEIATLLDDQPFQKGYHLLNWKPTEPAGLYVVTMKVGSGEEKRVKLIIQ